MTRRPPAGRGDTAQLRLAAGVIVVAALVWLAAQWLGPMFGLPLKYGFLVDFAVMAAFVWAMIVVFGIWRRRQHDEDE